jgi:hypothetical protein
MKNGKVVTVQDVKESLMRGQRINVVEHHDDLFS